MGWTQYNPINSSDAKDFTRTKGRCHIGDGGLAFGVWPLASGLSFRPFSSVCAVIRAVNKFSSLIFCTTIKRAYIASGSDGGLLCSSGSSDVWVLPSLEPLFKC